MEKLNAEESPLEKKWKRKQAQTEKEMVPLSNKEKIPLWKRLVLAELLAGV